MRDVFGEADLLKHASLHDIVCYHDKYYNRSVLQGVGTVSQIRFAWVNSI